MMKMLALLSGKKLTTLRILNIWKFILRYKISYFFSVNKFSWHTLILNNLLRTVLESYIQEQEVPSDKFTSDSEVIELDSDDDDDAIPFKSQDITLWYSEILKMLERRYPMAFDLVVKNVMTSNPRRKRNGLKNVLGKEEKKGI